MKNFTPNNFPERDKLLKLTQYEIENPNRPIPSKKIELVLKNLLQRQVQAQMASLVNSSKYFKEELIPMLYNILRK